MKFDQFTYERPNLEEIKPVFQQLLDKFKSASNVQKQVEAMKELNDIRLNIDTMQNICYIRHSIDTNDEFYKKEQDHIDEMMPEVHGMVTEYYKELVNSPYRKEVEEKWGKQLFALAESEMKTFSPDIVTLLQKENKLSSQYTKLMASAKIPFEGEERTLAQMGPFTQSVNRETRREAAQATVAFFEENQEELDRLFDELVKVRHTIATTLGYKNFVELGYYRMTRTDYTPDMVKVFRDQVKKHIVPLATELKERQEKRIGIDSMKFYDEGFKFTSGNAVPKGSPQWIIDNGKKMYEELSHETKEFFDFMIEHDLMDLEAKKGKAGGGYCTYIANHESPYIFSNFNGTSGDIDVLTHEAGHAFQVYSSRGFDIPEYIWPTYEACEIHSMSMEFFTWPWMNYFFEEDTDKYQFSHLSEALQFLPYGVAVDEFQHFVYENPEASPSERNAAWRKIEMEYLPHKDYDHISYLENGGFWQRQSHIYNSPFYYIDYTLAQICAFQFWKKMNLNREEAWNDYVDLCKLGGSLSFTGLVEAAKLDSPFQEGTVEKVIEPIRQWLNGIDDQSL
ncbi:MULTISPECIES: M3 family oligoendopeptidase [Rossellomorea]|jgi:M3 family oligoendopeptidase|uniref:M3 family oligoendopeptidase n=1 Tax=Rossellomorea TaxID=2837508 RepID=UPI0011E91CB1|nr:MULTISPECIES: M3 family oligoendopeptidase [Rossellomorea]MDT9023691.1 M3 family oligoendopeptidase [Rossellomorea sp. YC4-1]TYS90920.1 M3 family oligoendopeptidase [Rossellomorea aquimaris]